MTMILVLGARKLNVTNDRKRMVQAICQQRSVSHVGGEFVGFSDYSSETDHLFPHLPHAKGHRLL